jgi:exopolyphosphatase/guanosine-5'-triphosphate,3'-diphosphate pyrophosphatase
MSHGYSLDQLILANANESCHSNHVTSLALTLFDALHKPLDLPFAEREILEVACRLHDLGYRDAPAYHARESARLFLEQGPSNMPESRRARIAAVIALHQRKFEYVLGDLTNAYGLHNPRDVLRLGAILRIADGLDHGHVQDTTIGSVTVRGGEVQVEVHCGWYRGNVDRAEVKADLWRRVMPLSIAFSPHWPSRSGTPFAGLLDKDHGLGETCRRILYGLYRTVADARSDLLYNDNPEAVHDLRVGARRLKYASRLFEPVWPHRRLKSVCKAISKEARKMGPVRDADVWSEMLHEAQITERGREDPAWQRFSRQMAKLRRRRWQRLRRQVRSGELQAYLRELAYLLRVESPQCHGDNRKPSSAKQFFASRLDGMIDRIEERAASADGASPDQMHTLRRYCRKQRYLAEFAAPFFGRSGAEVVRQTKRITHVLGELHDADVHLAESLKREAPSWFLDYLHQQRKKAVKDYRKVLRKIGGQEHREALRRIVTPSS